MAADSTLQRIQTRSPAEEPATASRPASLVVFSDDWGRHPSSCQHLVRQLLPKQKVLWVNTIGTRTPRLDMATLRRVKEKLRQWTQRSATQNNERPPSSEHGNLTVVNPKMWPWFTRSLDRRLNAKLLQTQLTPLIRKLPQPVAAVTTLPITADLPGRLPVCRWVYYCVDDFGEWPGLDGDTLRQMDIAMTRRADRIVAVSQHLQHLTAERGRESSLLTHGVDLKHWTGATPDVANQSFELPSLDGPLAVFWGVVDRRLDSRMIERLSRQMPCGNIVLIGPQQDPDQLILRLPNVHAVGPRTFCALPSIARKADVLIMPYADLPVTRAMQPLKMKEYLATGRAVVVSDLPAVGEWRDCMDVATCPDTFASLVMTRIHNGVTPEQVAARCRLDSESWNSKAQQLENLLREVITTDRSAISASEAK